MLVEDVQLPTTDGTSTVLTGVVRGKGLNPDRLVQVGDWGTFQVEKITAAPLATRNKKTGDSMAVDEDPEAPLATPGEDQDNLDVLAPEVADKVYARLLKDGNPEVGKVAEALHYAIEEIRKRDPTDFDWIPFIHVGS